MAAVQSLCQRAILFHSGKILKAGQTEQIINTYIQSSSCASNGNLEFIKRQGSGRARFIKVYLEDKNGDFLDQVMAGQTVSVVMVYESKENLLPNARLSVAFYDTLGQVLFNCSSELTERDEINLPSSGVIRCVIPEFPLSQSEYVMVPFFEVNREVVDYINDGIRISVIDGDFYGTGRLYPPGWQGKGMLVKHQWKVGE